MDFATKVFFFCLAAFVTLSLVNAFVLAPNLAKATGHFCAAAARVDCSNNNETIKNAWDYCGVSLPNCCDVVAAESVQKTSGRKQNYRIGNNI